MNIIQKLFGKKEESKQPQRKNYSSGVYDKPSRGDDLTNPLNLTSSFWIGDDVAITNPETTNFGGGSGGGAGASGSWNDDSSNSSDSSSSSSDGGGDGGGD